MESRYQLTFRDKIAMGFRRSPAKEIAAQLARCRDAGIPMNPEFLEAHSLAGGDIRDLVDGLLFVKENQMQGGANEIAAMQLLSINADAPTVMEQLTELVAAGVHDAGHGLKLP